MLAIDSHHIYFYFFSFNERNVGRSFQPFPRGTINISRWIEHAFCGMKNKKKELRVLSIVAVIFTVMTT